jgi:hypothetical protein
VAIRRAVDVVAALLYIFNHEYTGGVLQIFELLRPLSSFTKE